MYKKKRHLRVVHNGRNNSSEPGSGTFKSKNELLDVEGVKGGGMPGTKWPRKRPFTVLTVELRYREEDL